MSEQDPNPVPIPQVMGLEERVSEQAHQLARAEEESQEARRFTVRFLCFCTLASRYAFFLCFTVRFVSFCTLHPQICNLKPEPPLNHTPLTLHHTT